MLSESVSFLADVQNQPDHRGISLDHVGVKGLHYPLLIRAKANARQPVRARLDILVRLHHGQRGAHLLDALPQA
jgi:GTP cyclohydrolase IB